MSKRGQCHPLCCGRTAPSSVPGAWGLGNLGLSAAPAPLCCPAKTHRRPEVRAPSFSRVKVADIFHRLVSARPLSLPRAWPPRGPPPLLGGLRPGRRGRGEGVTGQGSSQSTPSRASEPRRPPGAPLRVLRQEPLAAGGARPRDPRGGRLRLHAAGRLARAHRRGHPRGPRCGRATPRPAGGSWWGGGGQGRGQGQRVPLRTRPPVSPQAAGLQEGDYIVSVDGQPCRWWKHAQVVAQLRRVGAEGVSLQVATLLPGTEPPSTVSPGAGRVSHDLVP